jgi:hypothetical protein
MKITATNTIRQDLSDNTVGDFITLYYIATIDERIY